MVEFSQAALRQGIQGVDGKVRCKICLRPEDQVEVLIVLPPMVACPDCITLLWNGLEEYIEKKFKGVVVVDPSIEDAEIVGNPF